MIPRAKPPLLVLTSTFPRWANDPEPSFVQGLCKRLTRTFEVHALCPHAPGASREEVLDGVMVHRFRYAPESLETLVQGGGILNNLKHHPWKRLLLPLFFLGQAWATWRLIRLVGPACVHAHWIIPQGLVYVVVRPFLPNPPPFLLTSHGGDLFSLRGWLFARIKRVIIKRATEMTLVSQAMVPEAIYLGADPARVHVLPMGVDFDGLFTPGPVKARQPGEILFVGRLVEKKGLRHLIEAMPTILGQIPEAHLRIAGGGPEEPELRAQVNLLGITSQVEFLGPRPQTELPDLYRRASVFVAPFIEAASGDREGLGLVTVEAIACGCPVVVGDLPVLDEIFEPGEADLRVNPRQTQELANCIVEILRHPGPDTVRVFNIRERLERRLGWDKVASKYAHLISAILTHDRPL